MSNWLHLDCVTRISYIGSYTCNESNPKLVYNRNDILKKVYKAISKITKLDDGVIYKRIKFSITPNFKRKTIVLDNGYYKHCYNDDILINIYGDIRLPSKTIQDESVLENAIKDIWYDSDLHIYSGICRIRNDYYGDRVFSYDDDYNRIIIFKNDITELSYLSCFIRNFEIQKDKDIFIINEEKHKISDLFKNIDYYEKWFKDKFGIYIKIVNKEI